jgi:hypothetical protein
MSVIIPGLDYVGESVWEDDSKQISIGILLIMFACFHVHCHVSFVHFLHQSAKVCGLLIGHGLGQYLPHAARRQQGGSPRFGVTLLAEETMQFWNFRDFLSL